MPESLLRRVDRLLIPLLFAVALVMGTLHLSGMKTSSILWSDGEGYYLYLPATFIYGSWQQHDGEDGLYMISCCAVSEDKTVQTRYTYGVAALETPFFLGAHAWASLFQGQGTPPPEGYGEKEPDAWAQSLNDRRWSEKRGLATGFSRTYSIGILIGGLFYLCLGLFFVKEMLKRWFSLPVVLLTVASIFLATNLYYYATREPGMSHVYSFFLFASFLYLLPRFLERRSWVNALLTGAVLALIFIIRPTNLMVALFFLGFEVYSLSDLKKRIRLLTGRWLDFAVMVVVAALLILPQLLYWKFAFGSWLTYSYGDEGFIYWNKPQVLKVLFSHQNGWLMYTPVMALALIGMVMGWRKKVQSAPVMTLVLVFATYTFASWWAWWFGGAFGHRCYIEFYAILAWPLAKAIDFAFQKPGWFWRGGLIGMLVGFAYLNLKLTAMYQPPWDGDNWTFDRYLDVVKAALKFWN